jgi:ribonuclease HI
VVGTSGILLNARGNIVTHYSWGLGVTSRNIIEVYVLFQGLSITKEMKITNLGVFCDSMLVIQVFNNQLYSITNLFSEITHHITMFFQNFDELKFILLQDTLIL